MAIDASSAEYHLACLADKILTQQVYSPVYMVLQMDLVFNIMHASDEFTCTEDRNQNVAVRACLWRMMEDVQKLTFIDHPMGYGALLSACHELIGDESSDPLAVKVAEMARDVWGHGACNSSGVVHSWARLVSSYPAAADPRARPNAAVLIVDHLRYLAGLPMDLTPARELIERQLEGKFDKLRI